MNRGELMGGCGSFSSWESQRTPGGDLVEGNLASQVYDLGTGTGLELRAFFALGLKLCSQHPEMIPLSLALFVFKLFVGIICNDSKQHRTVLIKQKLPLYLQSPTDLDTLVIDFDIYFSV